MPRLKSRSKHPPLGFSLLLPEIGMKFPVKGSFNEVCIAFQRLIKANPAAAVKAGWPAHTDFDAVADWVDAHNASRLVALGYHGFVEDDSAVGPAFYDLAYHDAQKKTSFVAAAGRVSEGALLWAELVGPSGRTVTPIHAAARAFVCTRGGKDGGPCPKNDTSTSLFNIFIAATARALGGLFAILKERSLSTPYDSQLGVCSACLCPMKAKVHVTLDYALKHMDEPTLDRLSQSEPHCWLLVERESQLAQITAQITTQEPAHA